MYNLQDLQMDIEESRKRIKDNEREIKEARKNIKEIHKYNNQLKGEK